MRLELWIGRETSRASSTATLSTPDLDFLRSGCSSIPWQDQDLNESANPLLRRMPPLYATWHRVLQKCDTGPHSPHRKSHSFVFCPRVTFFDPLTRLRMSSFEGWMSSSLERFSDRWLLFSYSSSSKDSPIWSWCTSAKDFKAIEWTQNQVFFINAPDLKITEVHYPCFCLHYYFWGRQCSFRRW